MHSENKSTYWDTVDIVLELVRQCIYQSVTCSWHSWQLCKSALMQKIIIAPHAHTHTSSFAPPVVYDFDKNDVISATTCSFTHAFPVARVAQLPTHLEAASMGSHTATDGCATTPALNCWPPSIHCARPDGLELFAQRPPHTAGLWLLQTRDVTKFEFEFDNVRTSNIFNRFEIRQMF